MKEFEWFEWFGSSPIEPFNSGIDQRTSLAIGSAEEVDRFNDLVLTGEPPIPYVGEKSAPAGRKKNPKDGAYFLPT